MPDEWKKLTPKQERDIQKFVYGLEDIRNRRDHFISKRSTKNGRYVVQDISLISAVDLMVL